MSAHQLSVRIRSSGIISHVSVFISGSWLDHERKVMNPQKSSQDMFRSFTGNVRHGDRKREKRGKERNSRVVKSSTHEEISYVPDVFELVSHFSQDYTRLGKRS